jgi:phosphate-selective porin
MKRTLLVLAAAVALASPVFAQQTPAAPVPPETTVDASRGGITISSGVNSLTIGARPQFRWTVEDREQFDADTAGAGLGEPDGPLSQFDIARMRVSLSGTVYRPWMRYQFQFDFSRTGGEGGSKIKDAVFEFRPTGASYRFLAGQFKAPFGLQQLTSSGRLQFVDRAITDAKFNPGREMGVMFGATTAGRRIGYDIGVFNGSGESVRQNNRSHLVAGRVYYEPLGAYTLAEGSTDAPESPVLHIGVGARGGKAIRGRSITSTIEEADNETAFNVELAFKARRFFTSAEHFWMSDEQQNPTPGPDIDSRGYHAQASYMLLPPTTEVGVQYARIDGDTSHDDAEVTELRGVVNYYWQSHNLKVQADIGQVQYASAFAALPTRARQGLPALGTRLVTAEDLADTQLRVQLTIIF